MRVPERAAIHGRALAAAIAAALLTGAAAWSSGARMAALLALGIALGVTLYHAAFGFTSAYRDLIQRRITRGVRAQVVMIAVATLLFAPALAAGAIGERAVVGAIAGAGVAVAVGAFLFGIGMQLAGGCGSGTLFAAGAGHGRMLFTLAGFCAGSFWASLHMGLWQSLPAAAPVSLGERYGWGAATIAQLLVLGALWLVLLRVGRRAEASEAVDASQQRFPHLLRGPWPVLAGALVLALLNFATLALAGHPWTITWAFTLWGAKAGRLAGWSPEGDAFWQADFQRAALEAGIFSDATSVMDIGIVIGALAAAALAGRFALRLRHSARALALAALAGVVMGYGARIAFGCNIGAFFSGIASTSLHGWLWIAAALPGCWVGLRLRAVLRMD